MALFGKDRFPPSYQRAVGMNASSVLHKNSAELVNILKMYNVLNEQSVIFELGSGPARNLHYVYKEFNTTNLFCSDLFKDASLSNMSNEIRNFITFYEGDSEDVIKHTYIPNLDLMLISDHLMHLEYDKADRIIKMIINNWEPPYIMLRELKKEFETPEHPRLYHNYEQILDKYELISNTTSKQTDAYFIWLLKRK